MATKQATRNAQGKFQKGASGNPSGRPKVPKDPTLQQACKDLDADIMAMLKTVINSKKGKVADRIKAAELVLGYGHGKPRQTVEARVELTDIEFPQISIPNPSLPLPGDDDD